MLKLKEKLMEFCEGNVSTYSKSNNLPNMLNRVLKNSTTKNKQTNKTNLQTKIQNNKTNKSYWNWTNLEPRNNLITCFLWCFNIHLNLGFLLGLNVLKRFNKFNLFTLKKKLKKKMKNFVWGKPRIRLETPVF